MKEIHQKIVIGWDLPQDEGIGKEGLKGIIWMKMQCLRTIRQL